jgi:1-deoxy-D-xylulose-5-phosphate reductoisomerase
MNRPKNIAILGSTGSIGRNTLEVIRSLPQLLRAVALSGHSNVELLKRQANEFRPRWLVFSDPHAANWDDWQPPFETQVSMGPDAIVEVVRQPEVDVVVAAIVGSAGLLGTWAALEAGKTVALANKETLVMAGPLVMELVAERSSTLIPVDSEHSAILQAMQSGRKCDVKRLILTASGGPFRGLSAEELGRVTVEEALRHPTWNMGPKITVDSATMMNKALEIIEARWLFGLRPDQIDVVVHPQSIVHSLVEFVDGSIIAQLSPPDMKLPIQYALTYPDRCHGPAEQLDLTRVLSLEFLPPDTDRFPALLLGAEVAQAGGTAGAVLNAANEAAVSRFLRGEMPFTEIVPTCRTILESHHFDPRPKLDDLVRLDQWARHEVDRALCA